MLALLSPMGIARRRRGRIGLTDRGVVRASRAPLGELGSGLAAARVERMIEKRKEERMVVSVFVVCGGEVFRRGGRVLKGTEL